MTKKIKKMDLWLSEINFQKKTRKNKWKLIKKKSSKILLNQPLNTTIMESIQSQVHLWTGKSTNL